MSIDQCQDRVIGIVPVLIALDGLAIGDKFGGSLQVLVRLRIGIDDGLRNIGVRLDESHRYG
jgi:hypothetical protein